MKKLTGRGVLLILAGFFGVVILTNVIFVGRNTTNTDIQLPKRLTNGLVMSVWNDGKSKT